MWTVFPVVGRRGRAEGPEHRGDDDHGAGRGPNAVADPVESDRPALTGQTGWVDRVPVGFRAVGGDGPATLGQRNVLRWVGADPRADVLPEFVPVPAGRTIGDVGTAVGTLVERHDALRTCFPGPGIQRVREAGEVEIGLHELVGDRPDFVGKLVWAAMGVPFDLTRDLPVRADVVTAAGAPVLLILLFSHAAVDAAGAAIVAAETRTLLSGAGLSGAAPSGDGLSGDGRSGVGLPERGRQPRDQAEWERSPAGQRRTRAALKHWDTVLRRIPQAMLPVPHPLGTPGHREVRMRSARMARALPALVGRTGASESTILLAATATLVAARTGTPAGAIVSICGNRFRGDWREYVGPLAQDALVPYDTVAARDFDGLVRQVQATTLGAYRHAHFDSAELWQVIDAVGRDRGTHFHRDLVFNDLGARAGPQPVPAGPPAAAVLDPMPARTLPTSFLLTLGGVSAAEVDLRLHAALRYVPDVEDVLLDLERLVVAAAGGPVTGAATTVAAPGPGWVTVDGNLVDLDAVRALLPDGAEVVVEDGELVAHVTGIPAGLHAALPGNPAAMVPQRYVLR